MWCLYSSLANAILVLALLIVGPASAKQYERCEFGQVLADNGFTESELGPWICLGEETSRLNSSRYRYNPTTRSSLYGIFAISSKFWCYDDNNPQFPTDPEKNKCDIKCEVLLDDGLTDDLACARKIADSRPDFQAWYAYDYCRNRTLTDYVEGCKFTGVLPDPIGPNEIKGSDGRNNSMALGLGVSVPILLFCVVGLLAYKGFQHYRKAKVASPAKEFGETYVRQESIANNYQANDEPHVKDLAKALTERGVYEYSKYECASGDLEIRRDIVRGRGFSGIVYGGTYRAESIAAKTLQDANNSLSLIYELQVLTCVGEHPNVVQFLGTFTDRADNDKLYILLEYCEHGNLRDYLISHRRVPVQNLYPEGLYLQFEEISPEMNDELSVSDMIEWCVQVASAMEYLVLKNVIHGDLAARNILVKNQRLVKLTDFGLSKKLYNYIIYKRTKEKAVPYKWLSPEALVDSSYSAASDVWAFGVTLWEIFSLGQMPYPELTCPEYMKLINRGGRLERPRLALSAIYEIMLSCWQYEPTARPSFSQIRTQLLELTQEEDQGSNNLNDINNEVFITPI